MNSYDAYALANQVAVELKDSWRRYQGPRWAKIKGAEKALPFEVEVPALRGIDTTEFTTRASAEDFDSMVYGVRENNSSEGSRLTYLFHFDLGVSEDGSAYTGYAMIREKSFDWQM